MEVNYNKTIVACFIGYIVQAIVNNFVPLLFLMFHTSYGISLTKITLLITLNFGLQLIVDLVSVSFIDKIGYRAAMIMAHVFATLGLILLTILPDMFADPFIGLLIAVMTYAVGGGLLEVLVSPIVEACPTEHKEKTMSLLHSFYCWGHVGVVLISTIFFTCLGIANWKILAIVWAVIPFVNGFLFSKVPIASIVDDETKQLTLKELMTHKIFWLMILLMFCSGACEQAVSQWASTLAERGLGVSKTVGDLAGPMLFAICMGTSRAIYGKFGEKINLHKFMVYSALLCLVSYFMMGLVPVPVISFIGCGLCGLAVGILWPGTFSMSAASIRGGGTAMYAFLALAGDLGCSGGPTFVGMISSLFSDNLKMGILMASVFPILLLIGIFMKTKCLKGETKDQGKILTS